MLQVRLALNEEGALKGFGHVSFYTAEDTEKAVKLAGQMLSGRGLRSDYAPPRERKSFGGDAGGRGAGRGRGGGFGSSPSGRGGRGDGGRGRGGRGGGFSPTAGAKNKGVAVGGSGKKIPFD